MLEFYARKYLDIVHRFGLLLGHQTPLDPDVIRDVWSDLLEEAQRLDLPVTKQLLDALILELFNSDPEKFKLLGEGRFEIVGAQLTNERTRYHAESVYNTLLAELGSLKLWVLPREKSKYCDQNWLADSTFAAKYPDTLDEFQKAGRCFAYGENTACIFHIMRVTDFYLHRVAHSLGITYDNRNWHGIGDKITKMMEQKHQNKSDDWKKAEPFYAAILTDIQAIGRAHRNPTLHELERTYDEREARHLMTVIEGFANHVAEKL